MGPLIPPFSERADGKKPSRSNPYDPFFIPHSILFDTPISPQNDCRLLQLPPEILTIIFQKVQIPYFQVSLALTCKTMGRVACSKNAMAPWRGYRDKDGLFRLLERKNHWIPQSLRLCRSCFRFMPRSPAYWEERLRSPEFDNEKLNWYDIFSWFDADNSPGHRCPWCLIPGYLSYVTERKYLEHRRNGVLSEGVFRDVSRGMCPELDFRMDKP